MKKYYPVLVRVLFCILLFVCTRQTSGQVQTARFISTGPNSNGYYEYLPAQYSQDANKTFPLIVFLHGAGQLGNGTTQLPLLLQTPIPGLIAKGKFPDSFVVEGKTFEFIVISPQFVNWPSDDDVNGIIQYSMAHYRVDTGRIYLTGLSMGGDATWSYASSSQWAGLLAGIVPIASDSNYHGLRGAEAMAANNLAIFATHNKDDPILPCSGDIYNVDLVNSVKPPINPTAQFRMFYNSGHDAWDSTYNPKSIFYQGLNIYQWMLLYSRDPGGNMPPPLPPPPPLPLGFLTFTATPLGSAKPEVQLFWSDSSEKDNRDFMVQRSTDSVHFSTIDTIPADPEFNAGYVYSDVDPDPSPGVDYYRILQVHLDGTTSVSVVRKVQATPGAGVPPSGPASLSLSLSPNPATSTLYITIGGEVVESLQIRLVDVSGNTLRTWLFQKTDNNWIQQLDIGNLVPGMYFIQAFGKNWSAAQGFTKR